MKNNKTIKTLIIQVIFVVVLAVGITYAALVSLGTATINNLTLGALDVDYTGNSTLTVANLYPILANTVATNAQKFSFSVIGKSTNTVSGKYDVVIRDLVLTDNANISSNELKNSSVKWRLYKSGNLINSGDFSVVASSEATTANPFKLLLTATQQVLPASNQTADSYEFWLWIEETCPDYSSCTNPSLYNQGAMMNQKIAGELGVDLYVNK